MPLRLCRWVEVYEQIETVLRELRGRADIQYRLQLASADMLVLNFVEEAEDFVRGSPSAMLVFEAHVGFASLCGQIRQFQLSKDHQELIRAQIDLRAFRMRYGYYENKLQQFAQQSTEAGVQVRTLYSACSFDIAILSVCA